MNIRSWQISGRLKQWQAGLTALAASALCAGAQSADALIDKLVEKGILSVKEGNELRAESDKNFTQAYAVKSGMPDWVSALKFSGDMRLRYEGYLSSASFVNPGTTNRYPFQDKNRFRYRLRFGATATMYDNFEVGFRLSSGQPTGSFGGNPVSANQTFNGNAARNFVWIDQAYGKWTPLNGPDWTASITGGRFDNPFVLSDMIFDPNYTPEGAVVKASYAITDRQTVRWTSAGYVLNDLTPWDNDPFLVASQLRWDAVWSPKISSSVGFAGLYLMNGTNLDNPAVPNASVPNLNGGNTRNSFGSLTNNYYPIVADVALIYTVDSFPLYNGVFPIKVGGEYMYNTAATPGHSTDYYAWNAGITLGKAGKKGTWEFTYSYRWLGADSWYEEFTDNDFGAIYWQTPNEWFNSGAFPGFNATPGPTGPPRPANPNNSYWIPGTNVKGHIVRFAFSPSNALTLSVKAFLTRLIRAYPVTSDSTSTHLQLDASLKF
jgi:hypothetical protein